MLRESRRPGAPAAGWREGREGQSSPPVALPCLPRGGEGRGGEREDCPESGPPPPPPSSSVSLGSRPDIPKSPAENLEIAPEASLLQPAPQGRLEGPAGRRQAQAAERPSLLDLPLHAPQAPPAEGIGALP